jgi:hypothetical protein
MATELLHLHRQKKTVVSEIRDTYREGKEFCELVPSRVA